jgi:hypothetical protein
MKLEFTKMNGLGKPAPGNMRMPRARHVSAEKDARRIPDNPVTAKKTPKIPEFQTDLFG